MASKKKPEIDRGRVETNTLKRSISFNGNAISKAIIEIDHINHGINKKTRKLNDNKRTSFTVKDIEKFIMLLDGEEIIADDYKGKVSQFSFRINCPVKGRFYQKVFLMIFDTHYDKAEEIHTITLIPGW
jgi:hypothetical protein